MKHLRFFSVLLCTAVIFFLSSCNDSGNSASTEEKNSDSATTATNTAVTPSGIITTPQNMMVAIHKVSNFEKWKAAYEQHDSARLANGVHKYMIARGYEDSSTVMVAMKIDDLAKAKAFAADPGLKTTMQKGGVVGKPDVFFSTLIFQDTSTQPSKLRSLTTFKVKDWDAWRKAFESHKQERMDNGITDRAYGYDADDNHKVKLVTMITDTAKARAYWNSDLLKQRRSESGVEGSVNRFLYQVVQRY